MNDFKSKSEIVTQPRHFHSDHLGSTSYLTDHDGNVSQFVCYTPYGETLVDEHLTGMNSTFFAIEASPRQFANKFAITLGSHSIYHNGTFSISQMRKSKLACDLPWREKVREANDRTRYLFNGKELDTETNLYYYGARYFEPSTAVWYGSDPLREKYPFTSSYVYCNGNPVKYVDPDGEAWITAEYEGESFYYYDERINSQEDIVNVYYHGDHGETRNNYDISMVEGGTEIKDGNNTIILNDDGSFTINGVTIILPKIQTMGKVKNNY